MKNREKLSTRTSPYVFCYYIFYVGTNIDAAFEEGITLMNNNRNNSDDGRSNIIVFLTDGKTTVGESNETKILQNIRRWNRNNISVYSLGFGHYLNYDFIRLIALQVCKKQANIRNRKKQNYPSSVLILSVLTFISE